jgi:predicted Zn-dependent protease with MMP-like domain
MDNNEKELMDQLRQIVEAEDARLTEESHDEARIVSKGLFAELDKEFSDSTDSVLLYVANVDGDEALEAAKDAKHLSTTNAETVEELLQKLKEGEAKAARCSLAMPPVPREKLLEIIQEQEAVMLLHGWADPMALACRVVNDDGSVLKAISLPNDLAYEWTTADGKSEYRHTTYDQPIPEPEDFGGEGNMEMIQHLVTAAQQPRQLKRNFPDAFDALMKQVVQSMKDKMRERGIDPDSLG